jgi:hypothetical protein
MVEEEARRMPWWWLRYTAYLRVLYSAWKFSCVELHGISYSAWKFFSCVELHDASQSDPFFPLLVVANTTSRILHKLAAAPVTSPPLLFYMFFFSFRPCAMQLHAHYHTLSLT